MAKIDDTLTIPETITAPWLKRFFKNRLGFDNIRVENAGSSGYVGIRLVPENCKDYRAPLKYKKTFSPEFGQRCMAVVYKGSKELSQQAWGGNIGSTMIAMLGSQLREVLTGLLERPLTAS